ncbi:MAG: hypothetical protein ACE5E3_02930, partial [Mariprofundus sp.]
MSKRLQTITLFIAIAMLCTAKAGLNFWHTPADEELPNSVVASSVTSTVAVQSNDLQSFVAASEEAVADPWALLEAYLIPEASAEATPGTSRVVIEDETLTSLRQYKAELDQRSKQLDKREQTMGQAEEQLKRRITELEQLEASIQQRLRDESKVKSKKIKRLTAVYE